MEMNQEFVLGLVAQKDFDMDFGRRLKARGEQVCPFLLKIVNGEIDADTYMRKNAIAMLGTVGDETCVQTLLEMVEDERPEFRANAIRSLGRMGQADAADGLVQKLEQKGRSLTEGSLIVTALGQLGAGETLPAIEGFRRRVAREKRGAAHLARQLAEIDGVLGELKGVKADD